MSMMDESPRYYIKDGKLYHYTPADYYLSAGFTCGRDASTKMLGEATPELISKTLQDPKVYHIYDYTTEKYLTKENYGLTEHD